jgi:hypothetical protein
MRHQPSGGNMRRSDWIALIAAAGTLLGLVPSYKLYFAAKKPGNGKRGPKATEGSTEQVTTPHRKADEPIPPFMRALAQVAAAFLVFVIELVLYSAAAYTFNVKIDLNTMPLNWRVGFYSLFAIPGLLCLLAFINIFGTMRP